MSDLRPKNYVRHPGKAKQSPQEFAIATWNVGTLGSDCDHCNIDLGCIQETKVEGMSEQQLHAGHRLILMQQKTATYRGLGFIIEPIQFNSIQFIYLCLKHTYMQIIIKMQRRPAKGL